VGATEPVADARLVRITKDLSLLDVAGLQKEQAAQRWPIAA
jgi:hypothetical protein